MTKQTPVSVLDVARPTMDTSGALRALVRHRVSRLPRKGRGCTTVSAR